VFEPAAAQTLVPDFRVRVNGANLPLDAALDVLGVEVHDSLDAPSMCAIQLVNWDMNTMRMTWSDDARFAPGGTLEVHLGYVDRLARVFTGEITGLEPDFNASEMSLLTVRSYDRRHRLMRGRKTRAFAQMKDSDIAAQIAREAGLQVRAEDTRVKLEHVLQHDQTDFEFLLQRAQRLGYELMVDGATLHFRAHQHTRREAVQVSFEAGELLEFAPRLTTLGQVDVAAVRGWDMRKKEPIVSELKDGSVSATMGSSTGLAATRRAFGAATTTRTDTPIFTRSEADQLSAGHLNDLALGYIKGEAVCVGRAELRAGSVIKLAGLGNRFSGLYYVTAAVHTTSARVGYRTALQVRRNAAT